MSDNLSKILADLTGEVAPFEQNLTANVNHLFAGSGLGYSQVNELLLLCGYDRISAAFFQFLVDGTAKYCPGAVFTSLAAMREGVDGFRKWAIFRFGNVKYGFKYLSARSTDLLAELALLDINVDQEFFQRQRIPGQRVYFHVRHPEADPSSPAGYHRSRK